MPQITPAQVRAARHLVALSQKAVADATGLSLPTVKRAESERAVSVSPDAIGSIRAALEAAGVEFIVENDGSGVGVKLRRQRSGPISIAAEDLNASNDE